MRIVWSVLAALFMAVPVHAQVTVRGELTAADTVYPGRGRMDAYQIRVTRGDHITATARTASFDAKLVLMNPTSGSDNEGRDVAPWRGQAAGNAVSDTATTDGVWYVIVTSERAGLAGTELGPYELELVRVGRPLKETDVQRHPAAQALKMIDAARLSVAGFDTTRSTLDRVASLEQAAAIYKSLSWRRHRAYALLRAAARLDRETAPALQSKAREWGREGLREALALKDVVLESLAYSVMTDAAESTDSMLFYMEKSRELASAASPPWMLPGDTVNGQLGSGDILVDARGHVDLFEFAGKKGQTVYIRFFNRSVSTFTLLVSPAGDTVTSALNGGVIEHRLDRDGDWLLAFADALPDTGSYKLIVAFTDTSEGLPSVRAVAKTRTQQWVAARAFAKQAAEQSATPEAGTLFEKAARSYIAAQRPAEAALNLMFSGAALTHTNASAALARIREGIALVQPFADAGGIALGHFFLGATFDAAGQPDSAVVNFEQAAALFQNLGEARGEQSARDQVAAIRSRIALKRNVDGGITAQISADDVTWLSSNRPFDGWTFPAKSGDSITVTLRATGFRSHLRLLSPSGTDTVSAVGDSMSVRNVSGESGSWLVIVESADRNRGSYDLRITLNGKTIATSEATAIVPDRLRDYARAMLLQDSAKAAGQTSAAAELYRRAGDAFLKGLRNRQAFGAYLESHHTFKAIGRAEDARDVLVWSSPTVWNDSLFVDGRAVHSFFSGVGFAAEGRYAYAIEAYKRPFADFQRIGFGSSVWAYINHKIGDAHASLGQYEQALEYYQRARRDFTRHKLTQQLPYVTHGIGIAQLELGKTTEALQSFNEAVAGFRDVKDRASEGVALRSIAVVHQRSERQDAAAIFYHRALEIQRALGNRGELAAIFDGLGRAHLAAQRVDSAIVYHREALNINRQAQNRIGMGGSLRNLGRAYARRNELGKALAYYDSASVEFGAAREDAGFEAERISMADQFATLSQDWMRAWRGRSDMPPEAAALAALAVVERGRAQALIDLMRNARSRNVTAGADFPAEGRAITERLQARNVASLSYLTTADSLFAFVTTPGGSVHLHRVAIADSTITRMVAELRTSMGIDSAAAARTGEVLERTEGPGVRARAGNNSGYAAILKRLADVVLPKAVLDQLPANMDLVIVPHGSLSLVPFAALPSGDAPLDQRVRIRYAPSLTALLEAESRPVAPAAANRAQGIRSALVVGNPEMPSVYNADFDGKRQMDALPGAEREGRAVAQQLKAPFLTGAQATEPVVVERMKSAPLVHLATHGFAYGNDARSRESYIALAPTGDEDGLLTVGEVLSENNLTLAAELVVLSACQTGLGSRKVAEGTVGLQWAFLAKGARTVLVSLWNVDDAVTNTLMQSFYSHWMAGSTKAEALQKAQAEVRKTHPNPRYWAAFQLVGAN